MQILFQKMKNRIGLALIIILFYSINLSASSKSDSLTKISWLDSLINKGFYSSNSIIDIAAYKYKDKNVYLVNYNVACCDQYSAVLFDEHGIKISHPYGGISGYGDMLTSDFTKNRLDERIIWINSNPQIKSQPKPKSFKLEKTNN
jgi:hypothetical protein